MTDANESEQTSQSSSGAVESYTAGTIKVECDRLIDVSGPKGQRHHILIDPTKETRDRIYDWSESEEHKKIRVEDRSGLHESYTAQRVVNVRWATDTVIVTAV